MGIEVAFFALVAAGTAYSNDQQQQATSDQVGIEQSAVIALVERLVLAHNDEQKNQH